MIKKNNNKLKLTFIRDKTVKQKRISKKLQYKLIRIKIFLNPNKNSIQQKQIQLKSN